MLSSDKLLEYIAPLVQEYFFEDLPKIESEFEKHKEELQHTFLETIESLCEKAIQKQEKGEKDTISIMHICYLQTPILTRDYHVKIFLYNKMFYLDAKEISVEWKIPYLYSYFEEEYKNLCEQAKKNVVKVNYKDFHDIKVSLYLLYQQIIFEMLREVVPVMNQAPSFQKLHKTNEFCVTYGRYMLPGDTIDYKVGEEQ